MQNQDPVRNDLARYPWGRQLLEQAPQAQDSLAQAVSPDRVARFLSGGVDLLVTVIVVPGEPGNEEKPAAQRGREAGSPAPGRP
jgi:hypothetical protein